MEWKEIIQPGSIDLYTTVKKRPTLGLLIDWIGTPYHREIINGFIDYCQEKDINAYCFVTGRLDSQWESERCRNILFDFVSGHNVDGLVITSSSIGNLSGKNAVKVFLETLSYLPCVSIGESFPSIPFVGHDNEMGISLLMDHLLDHHGYTKFAFLKGSQDNEESQVRYNAFLGKLKKRGLSISPQNVYSGMFRHEDGYRAISSLITKNISSVEVLICSNDIQAMGALQALKEKQIAVPQQLAITGYDDNDFSRYSGFTTVRQSFWEQGWLAAESCFKLISGKETELIIKTRPRLIVRKSCGCPESLTLKTARPSLFIPEYKEHNQEHISFVQSAVKGVRLSPENLKTLGHWFQDLTEIFFKEINGSSVSLGFLEMWARIVDWSSEIPEIHAVLERVRENFMTSLIVFLQGESLWIPYWESISDSTRNILEQSIQRTLYFDKVLFDYRLEDIDETSERLMGTWEQAEQMDVIAESFPKLGIKQCYISRYEDPEKPLSLSRLILAYDEDYRFPLDSQGIQFPSTMLIPYGVSLNKKSSVFLVQALFQGMDQIGFALFDASSRDWRSLEILRHKLSLSLKSADMHKEIQGYTQRLEKQVEARTEELQKINTKLKMEIFERQRIEQKLRKNEEHFRELALLLPTIIIELDLRFRPIFINQAGCLLFGKEEKDVFGSESIIDYVHEEDKEPAEEYFHKILKTNKDAYGEMRFLNKEKKAVTVLVHACPLFQNGLVKGVRISGMRIKPLLASTVLPEELFFEHYHFSPRVKEVLLLMLQGYKTPEISAKLFISENTVKAHIRAIYVETGVKKREDFFKIVEEYQVNYFGYHSYLYTLLSKLIKD